MFVSPALVDATGVGDGSWSLGDVLSGFIMLPSLVVESSSAGSSISSNDTVDDIGDGDAFSDDVSDGEKNGGAVRDCGDKAETIDCETSDSKTDARF
jgi:hypothetical protein